MSSLGPKQHVFVSLAEIAQALGHAHRLELLEHLGQGERSVEGLAGHAGLKIANTSRHLQLLRRAGLVYGRREGKRVYYRLAAEDAVVGLLGALGRVGERRSARLSLTAAVPGASSPSKRSRCCGSGAIRCGGSRMAFRNGRWPACRSKAPHWLKSTRSEREVLHAAD